MNKHLQVATLIVSASMAAAAQTSDSRIYRSGNEWIQEVHGSLAAARTIKVVSSAGAIRVQGAQQNKVSYIIRKHVRAGSHVGSEEAARREFDKIRFTAGSGEIAVLRAECEGYSNSYIDFEIQAPTQTAFVVLKTEGGSVSALGLNGRVDVATGGGSINLDQIGGAITAESGGGSVEIGKVGSNVEVSTGSGSIHVDSAGGRIAASSGGGSLRIGYGKAMVLETGAGSIVVHKCDGQLKAETGGGSVEFHEVAGPASIETGGGGIKVWSISGGLRAETGSGPIMATLVRGGSAFTASRLETSVGDIIVFVPDGLGVTIRATVDVARGKGIETDFGNDIKIHTSGEVGPREVFAEGSLNGGGPVVHLHTSTGNIFIRRKGKE
ncbi:MAG TPA: hypothetical protein VKE93_05875 [Candidatus Angelobacter sp.]|nr:hypothetical protein [Candidatus Angelobacter sp.]